MSSPRPELLVAPCSYEAAKYAVEKWHYSKSSPAGKTVKYGVWENGSFIGVVIFSRGSNKAIGMPYGLIQTEVCELARIALTSHVTPVSKIAARAVKEIAAQQRLRLIVSYADPREGHIGGIYQAMNWVYVGTSTGDDHRNHPYEAPNGKIIHWRSMSGILARGGRPHTHAAAVSLGYKIMEFVPKHKYLYPLDRAMRRQIAPLAQPYPKKDTRPVNGDAFASSEAGRFNSEPGAL